MSQQVGRAERLAVARAQLVQAANLLGTDAALHWGLSEAQIRIAIEHIKRAISEIDADPTDDVRH
jgi:hypothetical protein